jgi:protein farnesyltransferase/geranylgeranyltransferase type-1 subunit alpha
VEKLGDFTQEMAYTEKVLEEDSKNYHVWAHRQWVVETQNFWEEELLYTARLISADFRNNSAWNERYFVITRNYQKDLNPEEILNQITFAFEWVKKAPNNQSPWSFIKG